MKRFFLASLLASAHIIFAGWGAASEPPEKEWYVAVRLAVQPYVVDEEGTLAGRDFSVSTSLSDILDKTDTTLLGGEIEFGRGKWFATLFAFYQDSEADKGDKSLGAEMAFKEVGLNPMVGYRVYDARLGGDSGLSVALMAGVSYVRIDTDIALYHPLYDAVSIEKEIEFTDPMVGVRAYYAFSRNIGVMALAEIGGFGAGSELQYILNGYFVYNFTEQVAGFAGYKYWYFKYEDDGARLSRLEQSLYGPVAGVQFTF